MAIGTFLAVAIEASGGDPNGLVSAALRHYGDALDGDDPPLGIPALLRAPVRRLAEVEVQIEPSLEVLLRTEAAKQRVAVESLLNHAVFLYLADLDRSGKIPGPRAEPSGA
jgi:hypothetical protein